LKGPLEPLLVESCLGLFTAFGVTLRQVPLGMTGERGPSTAPMGEDMIAAFVAFGGPPMRGTMALVTTFDLVASCRPIEARDRPLLQSSAGDWIHVRDWSKELANQLVGRIKRHVVSHGLSFDVGTPAAMTGAAMKRALDGLTVTPVRFNSGLGPVTAWLDVKITADMEARLATKQVDDALTREGDIILL
jgi:hypothetical protein